MIYSSLRIVPGTLIEGFVVPQILSFSYGSGSLDVVGKYTARATNGQVSALYIVVYTPTQVQSGR